MTAVFELDFSRLSDASEDAADRAAEDRWARIRAVATAISEVDLNHETDIVRALYKARFTATEFMPVLDDAIDLARERRKSI